MPDAGSGEAIRLFVVRRAPTLTEEALRAHCAAQLADYKVPETIAWRTEPLPRNANGKLMKRLLRQQLTTG